MGGHSGKIKVISQATPINMLFNTICTKKEIPGFTTCRIKGKDHNH
jgi:hypothetical protein